MSSNETEGSITSEQGQILLNVAVASIEHGLAQKQALDIKADDFPESLREFRATFVTLRIGERLRGCMGSLEASEPLIVNVSRNAFAAAFRDPRFSPLARDESGPLHIHLSLLSHPEPIEFQSEAELIKSLRPGIDGLILIEGGRRGTLLPSVWDTLDDPHEFLSHLKRKAGLPPDYWSTALRIERYTAESIERDRGQDVMGERPSP